MLLVLVSVLSCDVDRGGGDEAGFLSPEVFRDSHENGLVSFRGGGTALSGSASFFVGAFGGGGYEDWKVPDRPCIEELESRGGSFGGGGGGDWIEVRVDERECEDCWFIAADLPFSVSCDDICLV